MMTLDTSAGQNARNLLRFSGPAVAAGLAIAQATGAWADASRDSSGPRAGGAAGLGLIRLERPEDESLRGGSAAPLDSLAPRQERERERPVEFEVEEGVMFLPRVEEDANNRLQLRGLFRMELDLQPP
jgi:hypothetical protein